MRDFTGQLELGQTTSFLLLSADHQQGVRPLPIDRKTAHQPGRSPYTGTTLVELVVVVAVMTLVMGAIVPLFTHMRRSWDTWQNTSEAVQNGRVLIDHMHRNLAEATQITAVSNSSQTSGYIEFVDNNNTIQRYQIGTGNYVEFGEPGSLALLAGPVSQLQFTCHDDTDLSAAITDVNSIRCVKVQSTVVNAGAEGQDRVFTTSAYLRANGLPGSLNEITQGTPYEFDVSTGKTPALVQIDGTHYLCAYEGAGSDGWATVLTVNSGTWALSEGTPLEFDSVKGKTPALTQIDSIRYLCAYTGDGDDGWATILTVDTADWTVTKGTAFEFDTSKGKTPALSRIDDSHYLCAYAGAGDDGWAVVLTAESSLVGHWKLDEASGTTAADSSDMGNHGTLTNMAGNEWTAGQMGGALEFSGTIDYVEIANDATLQPTGELTLAAWIKGDSWGSGDDVDPILRKGTTTPVNYQLAIADQKVSLMLDDMDENDGIRGDTSLNTGQWYHVAAVWDGADVRIYVNGVLDNDPPDARTGTIGTDTRSLYMGGRPGEDYFDGTLDDVRIYTSPLSASEITALTQPPSFQQFTESKAGADTTSVTLAIPSETMTGDLLISAVATDGDTDTSLAPPSGEGWTEINTNSSSSEVTLGAWWKLAEASESSTHQFTWSGSEQAYGWMMRFTGHDASDPIDGYAGNYTSNSSSPTSPSVTSTVANALILRLGGFDDSDMTVDAPGLSGHTAITMDASDAGQVTFQEFTEKKVATNGTSVTVDTPAGAGTGDLLIAAVVTDGDTAADLAPPGGQGWTEIYLDDYVTNVTLGVWWKLAGASEPGTHQFTWSGDQEAYAWMMRFTGHHPSAPIHDWDMGNGTSDSPDCDAVTTTVANCMILRIGGFNDDDISVDSPGLSGHTAITMDASDSGFIDTCSGGAGYEQQPTAGVSSTPAFSLTGWEQYITLSVAIAPSPGASGAVSGAAGYVKQIPNGSSGTSTFSLTASEEARMVTVAVAPVSVIGFGSEGLTISQQTPYEFDTIQGKTPALAQIDGTHTLCAYTGSGGDGWATVLTVDTGTWDVSQGTSYEFDTVKGNEPALAQIDSTHYLCAYSGDGDDGWAVVLTVNTGSWTVSAGTAHEFDSATGKSPALTQIDSTHYLCAYSGIADHGWAAMLTVDTDNWTVTSVTAFEFENIRGKTPALEKIDSSHHLCAYGGLGDDGWSVVLMPTVNSVVP